MDLSTGAGGEGSFNPGAAIESGDGSLMPQPVRLALPIPRRGRTEWMAGFAPAFQIGILPKPVLA